MPQRAAGMALSLNKCCQAPGGLNTRYRPARQPLCIPIVDILVRAYPEVELRLLAGTRPLNLCSVMRI